MTAAYTLESIFSEIVTELTAAKAAGQTLSYVNAIYEGDTERIPAGGFPAICVDVSRMEEKPGPVPYFRIVNFAIEIILYMEIIDEAKQITGEGTGTKGILDFATDVINVLETTAVPSNQFLAGKAQNVKFSIRFDRFLEQYPHCRSAVVLVEPEFFSQRGSR